MTEREKVFQIMKQNAIKGGRFDLSNKDLKALFGGSKSFLNWVWKYIPELRTHPAFKNFKSPEVLA